MPQEERNEQYKGCQNEEWQTSDKRCLLEMRHKNVPNRQGLKIQI